MKTFPIHVRTMTGLEKVLERELSALGIRGIQTHKRVAVFEGSLEQLYRANVFTRTAIRVLRSIASFPAANEQDFYTGIRQIDWTPWIAPNGTLVVDADVFSSFTTHSLYLARLTKDAIVDEFREKTGERPSVELEGPDLRIVVSLFQNRAQVFLDSSGESLHKRGYRRRTGDAPLRETLAAGILALAGWDGSQPLLDPMCGSGTFPIEAALWATNTAPGLLGRRYGFQKWADYDEPLFEALLTEARAAVRPASAPIVGLEVDGATAQIARENVAQAGMQSAVTIENGDFFTKPLPLQAGTLVMNPPYDERLSVANVSQFYEKIGDRLRGGYSGWKAFLLSGNLDAAKHIGLNSTRSTELFNGSIECRLYHYDLASASQKPERQRWREAPAENPQWKIKAETFANRLRKNHKHLGKWAAREKVSCWRVYDWDIPELPFLVDLYGTQVHLAEVPRNHDHTPTEHASYLGYMAQAAADVLGVPVENVFLKNRKPQKTGGADFSPHGTTGEYSKVEEAGRFYLVNLTDFLDTGLFLEHRKMRARIAAEAKGRDFLDLYSYTGAFTVCAATGGAASTTTVDTASTYLEWAEEHLRLNGIRTGNHTFQRSDAMAFLSATQASFDLAVIDPPNRSVNRATGDVFEVQEHHGELLGRALKRLRPGGTIYFTTGFRSFQLDEASVRAAGATHIEEITAKTVSLDFDRKPGQRWWALRKA